MQIRAIVILILDPNRNPDHPKNVMPALLGAYEERARAIAQSVREVVWYCAVCVKLRAKNFKIP